jgi:hypothetical protein
MTVAALGPRTAMRGVTGFHHRHFPVRQLDPRSLAVRQRMGASAATCGIADYLPEIVRRRARWISPRTVPGTRLGGFAARSATSVRGNSIYKECDDNRQPTAFPGLAAVHADFRADRGFGFATARSPSICFLPYCISDARPSPREVRATRHRDGLRPGPCRTRDHVAHGRAIRAIWAPGQAGRNTVSIAQPNTGRG